ncbi:MAG: thiamine-phosphate kinase [Armatimonadota bacterium]
MRLRDIGEFGFIDRIAALAGRHPRTVVGIGDDAALLDLGGSELVAVTTDAMLEGSHFRLDWLSAKEVGWRAAAGALSDMAAMGAAPVSVFCTVGLPPQWPVERADALVGGIADAAQWAGAALTGGDVIASEHVLLDIMALGLVPPGQQLTRDGAEPGQVLAVTGALGGPAAAVAGLKALGPRALERDGLDQVRRRLAHPEPRIAAGRATAASGLASAAIDVSDGLMQDAGHIARRSRVRAVIEAERVPAVKGCAALAEELGSDARRWALAGGEDFELLLALDGGAVDALRALPAVAEVGLTVVGSVEEGEGVVALDECGETVELPRGGWDHFA